jgi:hypothetical protein
MQPFRAKSFIVLAPSGKSMVDAIGQTMTSAWDNAVSVLGNKITVDKLKILGYKCIQVDLTEVKP